MKGHAREGGAAMRPRGAKHVRILWGFVLIGGLGGAGVETWLLCLLPVGGELGLPLFLPCLAFPELSWCQVHDGDLGNRNADDTMLSQRSGSGQRWQLERAGPVLVCLPLLGLKQGRGRKEHGATSCRGRVRSQATCPASHLF